MLSCFQGSTSTVFEHILKFYVKKDSTILDLTYGQGLSWDWFKTKPNEHRYKLIKVDKRKLSEDVIQSDFNEYIKNLKEKVDCIYFDPPYYFKEKISQFDIAGQMLDAEEEVFWTEEEMEKTFKILEVEVPRVLSDGGIFIGKIMDGYIGKEYYPNAFNLFSHMSRGLKPKGTFICPLQRKDTIMKFIRPNHIYYLVFQKN